MMMRSLLVCGAELGKISRMIKMMCGFCNNEVNAIKILEHDKYHTELCMQCITAFDYN